MNGHRSANLLSSRLVEVSGLQYTYGDGAVALRGVELSLRAGEKVGLVGPNGSGKSTLLMCLNGLLVGQGSVRIEGVDVGPATLRQIRGRVGLVFQSPDDQLFMPTLEDDLAFGPINLGWESQQVHRQVHATAEQFGLTAMLDRAPHHLSMGQKHLAAIASVMVMRPVLLMMDEPTSSLDPRTRRRFIELLGSLEATLLIASHDLEMVGTTCKRVLVLDEGRIVADGAAAEILGNESLMLAHGLEPWRSRAAQV